MAVQLRPPVVTIMGHVDHGKTSLLDRIRQAHVAEGEAGGITQHIGAYQAQYKGHTLTFIDTPGHAAFAKMRSRGAAVTDVVVLVVAADDGVKPQTVESIQHILAAKVPFLVAINKMDAPGANPEAVKAQLTEHSVFVTGYGGDTETVLVSAKTGEGVDGLLDTLVTYGELLEIKGDPDGELEAVVIESKKDKSLGSLATVIVKNGTLTPRQTLYVGEEPIAIRTLTDAYGKTVSSATLSMPVQITGFSSPPPVGSTLSTSPLPLPVEEIASFPTWSDDTVLLKLFLKADFAGTLEAISGSLEKLEGVEIIGTGIGDVSESDVHLAETTGALIVTFQTKASGAMKKLAQHVGVEIKEYKIIYELLEALERRVYLLKNPANAEKESGRASVLATFAIRGQYILGCKLESGVLRKGDTVHVLSGDTIKRDSTIASIKVGKTDVESVSDGVECGIVLQHQGECAVGDVIQAYFIHIE